MPESTSDNQNSSQNDEAKKSNSKEKKLSMGYSNIERLDWAELCKAKGQTSKGRHRRKPSVTSKQKEELDNWKDMKGKRGWPSTHYLDCPVFEDSD